MLLTTHGRLTPVKVHDLEDETGRGVFSEDGAESIGIVSPTQVIDAFVKEMAGVNFILASCKRTCTLIKDGEMVLIQIW